MRGPRTCSIAGVAQIAHTMFYTRSGVQEHRLLMRRSVPAVAPALMR